MINRGEAGAEAKKMAKICGKKGAGGRRRKSSLWSEAIAHRELKRLILSLKFCLCSELAWHQKHNCRCLVVKMLQSMNLTVGSLVMRAAS